ncbi:MAG: hypothetical protein RR806_06340 [Oscillospiraceae bacterium]
MFRENEGDFAIPQEMLGELFSKIICDVLENDPEILLMKEQLREFREKENENFFNGEFSKIKNLYPDEPAKDISDFGEDFINLISTQKVDPIVAYEAVRLAKIKTSKTPPSMGSINPKNDSHQDFFTKDQVANMSQKEVKRYFDVIEKSMRKW